MSRIRACLFVSFAVGIWALGCGRGGKLPIMRTYPVSGKLTVNGKSVPKLEVIFQPKGEYGDRRRVPTGECEPDGSFKLGTYDQTDGAPAGSYFVKVAVLGSIADEATRDIVEQYKTAEHPAAEVEIKEGDNALAPIDLTGK